MENHEHHLKCRFGAASFALLLVFANAATNAQQYSIDWFTIDAGGGASTGGVYSVHGTVGQADASGPMMGGRYSLSGGFWSLLAVVPVPGAPLLTIARTATNTVVVSWPSPSSGFSLQQNTELNTTNWTVPAEPVSDNGIVKSIVLNPPTGNRFYRLIRPGSTQLHSDR